MTPRRRDDEQRNPSEPGIAAEGTEAADSKSGAAAPETGPGTEPGTEPGTGPGTEPGTGPGTEPGTGPGTEEEFAHQPVMAREVLELLTAVPPGLVVDGTVGGGGHARLLLEARPDVSVLGIDRDGDAVAAARVRLEPYGQRARVVRGGFEDIARIVAREGEGNLMGVLFDLGVSSPQLDRATRGFSYLADAPLDMRMDSRQPLTAAIVVNTYDEQ